MEKVRDPAISSKESPPSRDLKNLAKEQFDKKLYKEAIEYYTQAIATSQNDPTLYSNRSMCYEKLESYGLALDDAKKCLEVDSKFYKGYYRRGIAELSLGRFQNAVASFAIIKTIFPDNKDIQEKYKFCKFNAGRVAFTNALKFNEKSPFDDIDFEKLCFDDIKCDLVYDMDCPTLDFAKNLLEHYKKGKSLHYSQLYKILLSARKILKSRPSVVRVKINKPNKLTVCGDVHGQFYDVCNIFEINGFPSETNQYLFNGDFVDRGKYGVEVITVLFVFLVLYPNSFFLNRGNHETISLNRTYNFEREVIQKYSSETFNIFSELFECLPLAHIINDQAFVVHGGIPTYDNVKIEDMEKIYRFKQPSDGTPFFEMLWADPTEDMGKKPSPRGVGFLFGPDLTEKFCSLNKIKYIIRSHEAKMNGYEVTHNNQCITIFSAPNYCDEMGNLGAFIHLDEKMEPVYKTFEAVPHP